MYNQPDITINLIVLNIILKCLFMFGRYYTFIPRTLYVPILAIFFIFLSTNNYYNSYYTMYLL